MLSHDKEIVSCGCGICSYMGSGDIDQPRLINKTVWNYPSLFLDDLARKGWRGEQRSGEEAPANGFNEKEERTFEVH